MFIRLNVIAGKPGTNPSGSLKIKITQMKKSCSQKTLIIDITKLKQSISLKIWGKPLSKQVNCPPPVSVSGSKALLA